MTKLADYKGIDVTITGNYDVTDDQVEQNLMSLLPYYGITGVEVKDRDTVQKDDYVKVDYTGYLDGDAFDGGSATDTMIDVANNCDAAQKTNYIDGFSDGLVGAKVGDEVSSDVTFPENYQSSDLAGKKTTFKFKIKGIYKPVTMDTLTDDMVADAFTEQKITTGSRPSESGVMTFTSTFLPMTRLGTLTLRNVDAHIIPGIMVSNNRRVRYFLIV